VRGARAGRPDPCHARRAHRGRDRGRRRVGGDDHGRGDRPGPRPRAGGSERRMTAIAEQPAPAGEVESPRRLVDVVLRARTFGILVVLALFVLVTALIQPRFVSSSNLQFILAQTALYAFLAVGGAMVIITRNVDLSVGSVVGLSAYVSANMFHTHPGIAIPVVFLVGMGV